MLTAVRPFIEKSTEVNDTILDVLNDRLSLPKGELAKRHDIHENSGSESRVIKNPPNQAYTAEKAVLGAHTDFGSLVRAKFILLRMGISKLTDICADDDSRFCIIVSSEGCKYFLRAQSNGNM